VVVLWFVLLKQHVSKFRRRYRRVYSVCITSEFASACLLGRESVRRDTVVVLCPVLFNTHLCLHLTLRLHACSAGRACAATLWCGLCLVLWPTSQPPNHMLRLATHPRLFGVPNTQHARSAGRTCARTPWWCCALFSSTRICVYV